MRPFRLLDAVKTRRYLLIWLGLFLPTLGIGVFALGLLVREQARINALEERTNFAQAQTVADNATLIMAEIKTGVQQTLEAASGQGNEAARLEELAKTNPFIQSTYIWSADSSGDYIQTYSTEPAPITTQLLDLSTPPWGAAQPAPPIITQELVVQNNADLDSSYSYSNTQRKRSTLREFAQQNVESLNTLKKKEIAADAFEDATDEWIPASANRSGWLSATTAQPQWLAWYQQHTGDRVTGALLETATVLTQLEQAFPYIATGHITYRIESPNETTTSKSSLSSEQRIPLGDELPGWQLAYNAPPSTSSQSILLLGGSLVAILCTASLGSGTLILLRARKDARDSAQKSTFVSNVSHELRTPLTTIRMYAEMLEDGLIKEPTKQQRYLGTITAESQRLTRLVDNVLDFSHLDQGRKHYNVAPVNLSALVDTVLKSQEARLTQHTIQVNWTPPPKPIQLTSDSDALEQVILNLVDNAIKYAGKGPAIEIQLTQTTTEVELTITDHGPGIAPRDCDKVFNAFQRLDESLTSEQPGSGLGLSICRGIVRDLGGEITVHSKLGNGCSFIIRLPHTSKQFPK